MSRIHETNQDNNGKASGTTNDDEITIDDNWLNEVLSINESSLKYNQVIIDQEPKTVQLPPLVTDDEDVVDGSGSGDGIIIKNNHEVPDKITAHLTEQTSEKQKQKTNPHAHVRRLPDPVSGINLVDVENEQPSKKPSSTTTARPITSPVSTTKAVDKTGYYSGGEDTEVDDDDDFIEARTELGSGSEDIVPDVEEPLNITSVTTENTDQSKCSGISCRYGATCLVQNGIQTGCVCGMQCENFRGKPVCGSDGILYENLCHLQLESCSLQVNITMDTSAQCLKEDTTTKVPLPQCQTSYPYWTPWSLWIQSGDQEFRFRYCKRSGPFVLTDDSCNEPQMQVRQCTRREKKPCRSMLGLTSMEYEYSCSGVELSDISLIDEVFPDLHDEVGDCEYSLYDINIGKFIHKAWTIDDLDIKGDKTVWCKNRDRFIPFYDSTKQCHSTLERFCEESAKCHQKKKEKLKSKGNLKHNCWRKFLLGDELPAGFPGIHDKYYLCQHFARKDSYLGSSSKKPFYGTIYDTRQRIPMMSFGRFRNLSDTSIPVMKFMLEKGLVVTKKHKGVVSTVYNWINGADKKGMYYDNDDTSVCNLGRFQAVHADYESPEYKIQQLLPHSMTGNDIREKIATYTLTNAAPIHASLQGMWNTALSIARKYAVEKCGIPILLNHVRRQRNRVSRDHPEMYVISGVVSLDDVDNTIGNGVTVPYLFWFSGCCIKGADTASFALYARNVPDSLVISAPVAQLEILLSDLYNTTTNEPIKLFPAYDDICGSIKSDVSGQIKL